ncbi:MAG: ATP-binding protein [Alphaproteobacteria bacterium]|nr:ATP-binding protein [Alphaproteobacteria bacterium]
MYELTVISGKGGTGKTSIVGAFAHLASNHVMCDLDVDAANLHLLLAPEIKEQGAFYSGNIAIIDEEKCNNCGICKEMCKFDAILPPRHCEEQSDVAISLPISHVVDPVNCEGCGVCVHFCPQNAIDFPENYCGDWYISDTRFAPLVHARMSPGEENSGKLITFLRQTAVKVATQNNRDIIIYDGSPGIGCPVISSLTGTDMAVVVTEPTPSGLHDAKRILELCKHFSIAVAVIINKYDLNLENTGEIERFCADNYIKIAGKVPNNRIFVDAVVKGSVVTECGNETINIELQNIWNEVRTILTRVKK